jgi:hypothetical protein
MSVQAACDVRAHNRRVVKEGGSQGYVAVEAAVAVGLEKWLKAVLNDTRRV